MNLVSYFRSLNIKHLFPATNASFQSCGVFFQIDKMDSSAITRLSSCSPLNSNGEERCLELCTSPLSRVPQER